MFSPGVSANEIERVFSENLPRFADDLYPGVYTKERIKELACMAEEILTERHAKKFLFLTHYYLGAEFHEITDILGDSLELARRSVDRTETNLFFNTVHFMASNAKAYLGDRKRVFVCDQPEVLGCSLVASVDHGEVECWRAEHPSALLGASPSGVIICYINSDPYTKSIADIICTSRDAAAVLAHVFKEYPDARKLFMPDKYLAQAIIFKMTGSPLEVAEEEKYSRIIQCFATVNGTKSPIDIYDGACHVHKKIQEQDLLATMERHPDAIPLVHPECGCASSCIISPAFGTPALILSTKQMIDFARESKAKTFVVATERGHVYALRRALPEKQFFPASDAAYCEYMKGNTFEKFLDALKRDRIELVLCDDCCDPKNPYRDEAVYHIQKSVAEKARRAIDRMLAIQ